MRTLIFNRGTVLGMGMLQHFGRNGVLGTGLAAALLLSGCASTGASTQTAQAE